MTNETVAMEEFNKYATRPAPANKRGWTEFVDTLEIDIPRRVPDHLRYAPVKDVRITLRATAHSGKRRWSLRFAEIDGDLYVARVK